MFKELLKKFKQLICVHQYADINNYFTNGKIEDAHFQRCVLCGKKNNSGSMWPSIFLKQKGCNKWQK